MTSTGVNVSILCPCSAFWIGSELGSSAALSRAQLSHQNPKLGPLFIAKSFLPGSQPSPRLSGSHIRPFRSLHTHSIDQLPGSRHLVWSQLSALSEKPPSLASLLLRVQQQSYARPQYTSPLALTTPGPLPYLSNTWPFRYFLRLFRRALCSTRGQLQHPRRSPVQTCYLLRQ